MKKFIQSIILSVVLFQFQSAFAQQDASLIRNRLTEALQNANFPKPESAAYCITSSYTDSPSGITHIYLNQQIQGLEVFNLNASLHLNKTGMVVSFQHNFISQADKLVSLTKPKLTHDDALRIGLNSSGIAAGPILQKTANLNDGKMEWNLPDVSSETMRVKEGFFAIADRIQRSYQVEYFDDENNIWWNKQVDAGTGEILDQVTYTTHCEFPQYKVQSGSSNEFFFESEPEISLGKKSNNGTYNVFPFPLESPLNGPRQIMSSMSSPTASPFGWHDTNGVAGPEFYITRGNNVWAKEDTLNNNSTNGYSPNGGDSLVFNFPYSVSAKPRQNLNAAIVNLFYSNNVLHDIFYRYGFDEKSGNFQFKNYSGEGKGGDPVMADAQDGGGTSNANFQAPTDGNSGRMQMYLWPTSAASASNNTVGVMSPATAKGKYFGPQSLDGARLTPAGLNGKLVLLRDSNASTSYGCGLIANISEFSGKIVLIDRGGTCGTQSSVTRSKIKSAQNAGAIAVIIAHNSNGVTPSALSSGDPTIIIPSVTISYSTGILLKSALLSDEVFITLFDSSDFNPAIIFDSDIDNGVMAHEYGHGVSIRLTGGPATSSCLGNQEQAGEGWSDFFCLALTTQPWHNNTTTRGIGNFLINEDTLGLGIRNYRYSRNMLINPTTYNSIKSLPVPHGVGSVWCTMLYDLYWDMIDKYGFNPDWYNGNGGNNKMMQLVMDGLKLQKCSPGFVDARDAILKADSINNGNTNRELLWRGFARRGLGFYANQGSSTSRSDGIESYALPPDINALGELDGSKDFRVYPNPAGGQITADVFGGMSVKGIELYDLAGNLVQSEQFPMNHSPSATIRLSLSPGCYLVRIITESGMGYRKLIVH